jgi:hypothetical protein
MRVPLLPKPVSRELWVLVLVGSGIAVKDTRRSGRGSKSTSGRRFTRSEAKAMDPEIARNQDYDDHYANDGKDVHFCSTPLDGDGARRACTPRIRHLAQLCFRRRWLGSAEAKQSRSHRYRHRLYPQ